MPTIYADAVIDVVFGFYTTKLVLGEELGNGQTRAAAVVAIPTEQLVRVCAGIVNEMSSPSMIRGIEKRQESYLGSLKDLFQAVHAPPKGKA
ncbi:hypothetical protein [Pelomonas sp. KK5]|uniref:hypothetical protein n=1 Tax=Pelomonas sp. KK5 TaxID=1855730 RepID=UPI00117C2889|nr:hypothetical protein [Pelomonas sp. KK5]